MLAAMRWLLVLALLEVSSAHADPDALAALLAHTDAVAKEGATDHKSREEPAAEGLALARWGMIPLDTDYLQMQVELETDQIAGYYDSDTKKLTILQNATDDPDWAEMVLAHELDHGLQDQSFDLKKLEDVPDGEDDAALARHALIEGDGVALMIEVLL